MTAHELARLLLAGPDVEVVGLSDHPADDGGEYKVDGVEPRRLYWVSIKTSYSPEPKRCLSTDNSALSQGAFERRPLDVDPVDVLVIKSGDWLDEPGEKPRGSAS